MEKLQPDNIVSNLLNSSLYLTAFELLKSAIIEKTWDFITIRYFADKEGAKQQFKKKVMEPFAPRDEKDRIIYDKYFACCKWLAWMKAIREEEVGLLVKIRDHRNAVAHELPNLLLDNDRNFDHALFDELQRLHRAIRLFWARIDIDISGEFDSQEIRDEDIGTPSVSIVEYIAGIIKAKNEN